MMKLHARLQVLADGRGASRDALAAAMGFSAEDVAAFLEGRRPIGPAVLTAFLDALGVRLAGARTDFHKQAVREAGWEIGHP